MRLLIAGTLAALALTPALGQAAGTEREQLQSTRETLAKWVETQQVISSEKKEWAYGKEVLEQRISMVENEIENLRGRVEETRGAIRETDAKRSELLAEERDLKAASAALAEAIPGLEERTRELVRLLPDSVADKVSILAERIPEDPSTSKQSLSQRFQNVIGILNEVNKFNQTITVAPELKKLPSGEMAEVTALYIGLGLAYYVTPDGKSAAIGKPTPDGWVWEEANGFASRISEVVKIINNESVPAYVPLPAAVR